MKRFYVILQPITGKNDMVSKCYDIKILEILAKIDEVWLVGELLTTE